MRKLCAFSACLLLLASEDASAVSGEWRGYKMVTSKTKIPPAVFQALESLCSPCTFADFGAPFNSTDILPNAGLPQRRLVRVDYTDEEWIIEYEHGGRGLHRHVAVFNLRPSVHLVRGSSCDPSRELHCEW